MHKIGNVAKLAKVMLALFAGIILLTSSFAIAEKPKARLQMFLFPNASQLPCSMDGCDLNKIPPNYRGMAESTSVMGFLKDVSNNGIVNRQIVIYVNNILMGKASTDPKGCFYFNSWNNTKLKPLLDKAMNAGWMIPIKVRAVFNGDNDYGRTLAYRKGIIYTEFVASLRPPLLPPYVILPKNGSLPLGLTVNAGDSADLPIMVRSLVGSINITPHFFAVPCAVYASINPSTINLNKTADAVIHVSADSDAKAGDYTMGIGILETGHLVDLDPIYLKIIHKHP